MEKEFIPYEEALDLQELGFDGECFGYYTLSRNINIFYNTSINDRINSKTKDVFNSEVITSPTFSQAFRWFREKYFLHSCISAMNNGIELLYAPLIDIIDKKHKAILDFDVYISYEEAELECLKKLIEIIKEKQNAGTI